MRLVLNELHADTSEQIEIRRGAQEIEIEGWVETEARKRQLQTSLSMVPHVNASIHSTAELRNNPDAAGRIASMGAGSMTDYVSPLESYLRAHGRSQEAISHFSQKLFFVALSISQETKAVNDLRTRFGADGQRTVIASATLSNLLFNHRQRLEEAIEEERGLLAEAQGNPHVGPSGSFSGHRLQENAQRNLDLSKELTATGTPATRKAEVILADLAVSLNELETDAAQIHGNLQGNVAQDGRK